MECGITHGSRPRTDNRDRGDLLANVFASDYKHCYDTAMKSLVLRGRREHVDHGDCHGGNFFALVAMQAWFDPVLQDLLQTPARTAKYLNHNDLNATIQTEEFLSHVSHRRK